MGRWKKAVSTAATMGGAAVFLGSLAFLVPTLLGYDRYVITGGSMTGTYDVGSIVFEKPVAVKDLAVGDVITYLPPQTSGVPNLVTHRIVDIHRSAAGRLVYRTQGDANPQVDPWTFHLDRPVQDKVTFGVPYVGHVFLALADRDRRMLLIGIPAGLIALISLVQVAKAVRPSRAHPAAPLTAD